MDLNFLRKFAEAALAARQVGIFKRTDFNHGSVENIASKCPLGRLLLQRRLRILGGESGEQRIFDGALQ